MYIYIYNYIALYRDLRKILFFEACVGEKSHITNPYDTKSLKLQDREQKQAGSYFLMEEWVAQLRCLEVYKLWTFVDILNPAS